MTKKNKLAVLGGGGRTGGYVVNQLLNRGYHLNLLLRNPENFHLKNSSIDIIKGDALDTNAIRSVVKDCHAVISTIGQRQGEPLVASQATINVLNAMKTFDIKRYILVAGINIDTPYDKKGPATIAATEWMKKNFSDIQTDRQNAYSILENSIVNWTMVRVPLIEFKEASGKTMVSLEDCLGSNISAGTIAEFVVEQLEDDAYIKKSPFIF